MKKCPHCGAPNPRANNDCYGCKKPMEIPQAPKPEEPDVIEMKDPNWVKIGYRKIRLRQIAGLVVGVLLIILCAALTQGAVWSAPLFVLLLTGIGGFIWWNWRCPACEEFLAKAHREGKTGYCRACREQLWE